MKLRFNGITITNRPGNIVQLAVTLDGVELPFKQDNEIRAQILGVDQLAYRFDAIIETADLLDRALMDQVLDDFEAASFAARWNAMEGDAAETARLDAIANEKRAVLRALMVQPPPRIQPMDKPKK